VRRRTRIALAVAAALLFIPFVVPERARVPVAGASRSDWNKASFWYEPWGASGVHKGIDIFAPSGRSVVAPVPGLVIYRGRLGIGGNVVAVLGPKWRIHYFAHLEESSAHLLHFVRRGEAVGKVGTSGNAAGKAPHLHYAVLQLIPRVWKASGATQGWKRMFFVDPNELLGAA
jgi:peptidoglycan LD-endopeptidase LytH